MGYESVNPFTEQSLKSFPEHSNEHIGVLAQADSAYRNVWRTLAFEERAAVLKNAVADLPRNKEHFARLATLEMGKLFREALDEVNDCADILEYYAVQAADMLAMNCFVKQAQSQVCTAMCSSRTSKRKSSSPIPVYTGSP